MKIGAVLVLGAAGRQGRAVIEDLTKRCRVEQIIAADCDLAEMEAFAASLDAGTIDLRRLDATDAGALRALMAEDAAVVIDMLPVQFAEKDVHAAIDVGVHLVNTNYAHTVRCLDDAARARGVTIMPECGLDPGIDLVMAKLAVSRFDEVEALLSYGGGVPAAECKDTNPLRYKISWNFAGVLRSYWRAARVLMGGKQVEAAPHEIFTRRWTHTVSSDEFGEMEAFVNGDAVAFADMLGIRDTVKTTARYALRWPGHCAFWSKVSALGLLNEAVPGWSDISPREFLRRQLEPRLGYADDERDMVVLRVDAVGTKNGTRSARRLELVDYRDMETGLMAMNRTVGYPASIVGQMILRGDIRRRGIGSPARDVAPGAFFEALAQRGIHVRETDVAPSDCFLPEGPQ